MLRMKISEMDVAKRLRLSRLMPGRLVNLDIDLVPAFVTIAETRTSPARRSGWAAPSPP
jgi:hypothetical protein